MPEKDEKIKPFCPECLETLANWPDGKMICGNINCSKGGKAINAMPQKNESMIN
jgi:hypothetical protein